MEPQSRSRRALAMNEYSALGNIFGSGMPLAREHELLFGRVGAPEVESAPLALDIRIDRSGLGLWTLPEGDPT
jgi:hypothetical protein